MFRQNPQVRRWTELNAPFAANSNRGPKEGQRWLIDWSGPLVVSAVHAVDHVRDGRWKNTDAGTGGLAMALGEVVGCSRIAVTRSVPMTGDANLDAYHPLKAADVKTDPDGGRRGFGATKAATMTRWAQQLGATAVQVEISRSFRATHSPDQLKRRLTTGLVAALHDERARLAALTHGALQQTAV